MNDIKEFSPFLCEKLGFYVYLLIDPETDKVFYVGKGYGNRIFAHINHALSSPHHSDKLEMIRSIQSKGMQVKHLIHRHGLTEKEAYEVEASLIDFIGLAGITNITGGHDSEYRGSMSVKEVVTLCDALEINIIEPSILITVNRLFIRGMHEDQLYEITRGNWVVGKRRNKAKFVFSIFKGNVQEVYEIHSWFPIKARSQDARTQDRWRFNGIVAKDLQHYVGGSVEKYVGSQNPIRYVNC